MKPNDIILVQQSWQDVKPIAETAASMFYRRLFELDPALRKLFGRDMHEQGKRLMAMLDFVIGRLDDLGQLVPQVEALGRRHASYGVTEEHYHVVGAALIWTLAQGLGQAFTRELESAWLNVYTTLADTMRGAAHPHAA